MPQVRRALFLIDELGLDPWTNADTYPYLASPLCVDRRGQIYVRKGGEVMNLDRQPVLLSGEVLALTAPFDIDGARGPDLIRPRPHLRIVPARVAGEPHIEHTRLTTQTIAALGSRGFSSERIAAMYEQREASIVEAIDLERQLSRAAA
jgi:uncharacterized protein (DUF433 family)